jgi:two-component system phosphate regulon response regulator PhoB
MPRVLIVEDETDLVELLKYNLERNRFETSAATTGEAALVEARRQPPSVILLDVMLPDMSGIDVCRQLRASGDTAQVPIVMLTAKGELQDRVAGLEAGADDYIPKPFNIAEVILRLKAVLRRIPMDASSAVCGLIKLDIAAHRCFVATQEVELTTLEFKIVEYLIAWSERVRTREQLLSEVWGLSSRLETRTVDTHMMRLREKLGPARHQLQTVRGVGYRLSANAPSRPRG